MPAAQLGRQEPVVGRLRRQLRIADILTADILIMDRGGARPVIFQGYAPWANGGLGEAGPWRLLEPARNSLRNRLGYAVEHQRLQFLPGFEFFNHN
jgi:hypothetical protein